MCYEVDFYDFEISGLFYTSGRAALRYRLCVMRLIFMTLKSLSYSTPLGVPP